MNAYLITTDLEKCVGCHRCIDGCPIPDANVSIEDNGLPKIHVNGDKCIHCGRCFESCKHEARIYIDDIEAFFLDLADHKNISIVAAPSIQTNFPFNYKKFFGYLKALGIHKIYDVSLGADITTWAYIQYLREHQMPSIVSQPCAVIVNYFEKYKPEILSHLAPIQSPMICTAIYMRKYMNITDSIAAISPCIAKKDEFMDKNTHANIQYNVTYKKIEKYIAQKNIDIEQYPEVEFDNISAEFGTLFPRPGGLKENVEYHFENAWVKQLEGTDRIFDYLDEYSVRLLSAQKVPLIVDILNCPRGCNHGTGASETMGIDEIDHILHQRKLDVKKNKALKLNKSLALYDYFDQNISPKLFERKYEDKSINVPIPKDAELNAIFVEMLKITDSERSINCSACGYKSCKDMATAIFKDINQKTNCINYNKKMVEIEKDMLEHKNIELQNVLKKLEIINEMSNALKEYNQKLEGYSMTDSLTGLCNRRCITEKIDEVTQRAIHFGEIYSILIIDIDHFKIVNDEYGHDAGDSVLKEISELMTTALRSHDVLSRWGGEEFLCVLPDTKVSGGFNLAERIRRIIEEHVFIYNSHLIKITVTIGISEFDPLMAIEETLKKADVALYSGKNKGRNCTIKAEY